MDPIEILPAIPGHSHSFDANGRPTCGCTMPVINLNYQATNATPDFRRMADLLLARLLEAGQKGMIAEVNTVAEQLRQVWNLRGAADCRAIDTRLSALTGWVTSEPYRKQLREAIEAADAT